MSADKYVYPGTNVLINLFDERDPKKLEAFEVAFTGLRLAELSVKPIIGSFDFSHLKQIHKYIFQDIYPFAGQIRDVNIAKDAFQFANVQYIQSSSMQIFMDLKKDNHLKGLSKEEFSIKAAKYFTDINILHPFREGNGRTQREFIRSLAGRNGYELDWSKVSEKQLFDASVKAVVNENPLAQLISKCILNEKPDQTLRQSFVRTVNRERFLER